MKQLFAPTVSQIWVSTGRLLVIVRPGRLTNARTMSVRGLQNSQLPSLHAGAQGTSSFGSAKGFLHCGFKNALAVEATDLLEEGKESIIIPSLATPAIFDLSCLSLYGFQRETRALEDKGSGHFRATHIQYRLISQLYGSI